MYVINMYPQKRPLLRKKYKCSFFHVFSQLSRNILHNSIKVPICVKYKSHFQQHRVRMMGWRHHFSNEAFIENAVDVDEVVVAAFSHINKPSYLEDSLVPYPCFLLKLWQHQPAATILIILTFDIFFY